MTTLAERVRLRREALGLSRRAAAERSGVNETYFRDLEENPLQEPRRSNLKKIAAGLGVTLEWLEGGAGAPEGDGDRLVNDGLPVVMVPVRGTVAAGIWRDAWDEVAGMAPEDIERIPFVPLPGYPVGSLFALRVEGTSMNLEYPPGVRIVCAPLDVAEPMSGDHVVVLRRRHGLAEATVKELAEAPGGGWLLRPRSSDPAWQEVWTFTDDGEEAPEIVGIVLAALKHRQRGRPLAPPTPRAKKGRRAKPDQG